MVYSIDIGTSSCKACSYDGINIKLIQLADGITSFWGDKNLMVSSAYIDGEDNDRLLVGQEAYNKSNLHPEWYIYEFKRRFHQTTPVLMTNTSQKTVDDIYIKILSNLKKKINFGEKDILVITHPAYYSQEDEERLKKSASDVGFLNVLTIDEPSAAAFAYSSCAVGEKVLIYDLGGGTFDVALLKKKEDGFEYLTGAMGLKQCGGSDIDEILFEDFRKKLCFALPDLGEKYLSMPKQLIWVKEILLKIKHRLSVEESVCQSFIIGFDVFDYKITQNEFIGLVIKLIEKTVNCCKDIVKKAGLTEKQINKIILVGGASKICVVKTYLEKIFTVANIVCNDNRDHLVCYGAVLSNNLPKKIKQQQSVNIDTREKKTETYISDPICDFVIEDGVLKHSFSNKINIRIPTEVTSIEDAFLSCKNLQSVTIPGSVKSIDEHSFDGCVNLKEIKVINNNQCYSDINGVLFNKNKTHLLKFPSGKLIAKYMLPVSITNIRKFAFNFCKNLQSVTIPGSVKSIGEHSFDGCINLKEIKVINNNQCYSDINGVLFNKDKTKLIKFPSGNLNTEYEIPAGVTSIEKKAFENCKNLKSLNIPDTVKYIKNNAFINCKSLNTIKIPNSVITIGNNLFDGCDNLKSIIIPENIDISKVQLSENCSVEKVIQNNEFEIENGVLVKYKGNKGDVEIPAGVTVIGEKAFKDSIQLQSITIPAGVTNIGKEAFSWCWNLQSAVLYSGVISIDDYAFNQCTQLQSVTIPSSVTTIGDKAFAFCENLKSISIPANVTIIGKSVFLLCRNLKEIKVFSDLDISNTSYPSDCNIIRILPKNNSETKEETIENTNQISLLQNGFEIKNSVLKRYNGNKSVIVIPFGVKNIGNYAFSWCENLKSVTIPTSVTTIENKAFYSCKNLKSITIPVSVTFIGKDVFAWCENLKEIKVPKYLDISRIGYPPKCEIKRY